MQQIANPFTAVKFEFTSKMQSRRRTCILCGKEAVTFRRLHDHWTPRWLSIDKGEGTYWHHAVLCGVCVETHWFESSHSLRREDPRGENPKSRRQSDRHIQAVGEDVAREIARNSPDDPWQVGEKLYDTSTRVTIHGKYHGEEELHDNSESSDEDAASRPMSMDLDL